MTPFQINLFFISLILLALWLVILAARHFKPWLLWIVPIFALLLHGLIYSIVYIKDLVDGLSNPLLYNAWNNVLRAQTYLTVIMYAVAFLVVQRGFRKNG